MAREHCLLPITRQRSAAFKFSLLTLALVSPTLVPSVVGRATPAQKFVSRDTTLDNWINTETNVAWKQMLNNVSPQGADTGCIVASPSTANPDYWYQWTRDAALTMKTVVSNWTRTSSSNSLKVIQDYISETSKIQHANTVIGGFSNGGLGEPKYNVDGTDFTGPWVRPQRDGPALRAISLITFANAYLDKHPGDSTAQNYVKTNLYDGAYPTNSAIKGDLEYVSNNWSGTGFDLWEEVNGAHFFTLLASHRSLLLGAALATRLSDPGAASYYNQQANSVASALEQFWNANGGYILSTVNYSDSHGKSTWLDVGTLLGVLHGIGAPGSGDVDGTWGVRSDRAVATHKAIVDSFRSVYSINSGISSKAAVAVGRYPEDVYDGTGTSRGNPWYLTTLAAAEFLYRVIKPSSNSTSASITLNSLNLPFYSQFTTQSLSSGQRITVGDGGSIDQGIRGVADGYMQIVKQYARTNGSLNEEFDRSTGAPTGARELTWSYAAFLTAASARAGTPIVF